MGRGLRGGQSESLSTASEPLRAQAAHSRRIAAVEPVFANLRHHKDMRRFTLRGKAKVSTQWNLFCLVHHIENIARCKRTLTALRPSGSNRVDSTTQSTPMRIQSLTRCSDPLAILRAGVLRSLVRRHK